MYVMTLAWSRVACPALTRLRPLTGREKEAREEDRGVRKAIHPSLSKIGGVHCSVKQE